MKETPLDSEEKLYGIERLFTFLLDIWSIKTPKPANGHRLFAFLLVLICVTTFIIGVVPPVKYGHDTFFLLENGWRAIHGQRVQVDYWSPWGPITFLILGFGLKLAKYSPNAIGYANACVALLMGLWAYRLGSNRLTANARLLLALYAALLVCSPYPLGDSPLMSSHAMLYNRYGYALVALVMLECLVPLREVKRASEECLGGFSTGAAMAIALFLKASFFAGSIPFVIFAAIFWRFDPKRWAGLILGFGVVSLACMAYLRFDFAVVLNALRMAAGARSATLSPKAPFWLIESHLPSLGLALTIGIAASLLRRGPRLWFDALEIPVAAVLVYFIDIVLLSTNAQSTALPLLPVFGLFVASRLSDSRQTLSAATVCSSLPFHTSLFVLCSVVFLPQFASDVTGLLVGAIRKLYPSTQTCTVRFAEARLRDLILCDHPANTQKSANGSIYTAMVNDGAALLRLHARSTDKVLTMDMQNPFPYALGWPPPLGGMASTAFNYTFSARYRPTSAAYFGDATVVMVPKHPAQTPQFIDGLYAIYLPALVERYQLAAESDKWRLYKIK